MLSSGPTWRCPTSASTGQVVEASRSIRGRQLLETSEPECAAVINRLLFQPCFHIIKERERTSFLVGMIAPLL